MAATTKPAKKHRIISSSFFEGCFGCSRQHDYVWNMEKNSDGKLIAPGKKRPGQARTVPSSRSTLKTSSSLYAVGSSKQFHVIEAMERSSPKAHQVLNNKENSKTLQESSPVVGSPTQEVWRKPVKLSHSMSLPPPPPPWQKREKWAAAGGGGQGKRGKELIMAADELDPIVGALIVMVTLIVMLIWGQVCAIICAAAWFYFIPGFIANNNKFYVMKLKNSWSHIDFNSREYKKKVVLEGFLERESTCSSLGANTKGF